MESIDLSKYEYPGYFLDIDSITKIVTRLEERESNFCIRGVNIWHDQRKLPGAYYYFDYDEFSQLVDVIRKHLSAI